MNDNGAGGYHPDALQARSDLEPVSARVYEALEYGIECGQDFFGDHPLDPWLFPHIVRFRTCERLSEHQSQFSVKQNPMSGIEISHQGYHIRVFKKCGPEEYLYPPGHSQGRQDFYDQQLVLPGTVHLMAVPLRPNLAYVWEPVGADLELHLVCPNGFESIWKPGECRWDIPIEHPATEFTPDIDFAGGDEDLPINLDEAAGESDDDEDL